MGWAGGLRDKEEGERGGWVRVKEKEKGRRKEVYGQGLKKI
jgi:hypothetical protein